MVEITQFIELLKDPILILLVLILLIIFSANKIGFFAKLGREKTAEVTQVTLYFVFVMIAIKVSFDFVSKNGELGAYLIAFFWFLFTMVYLIKYFDNIKSRKENEEYISTKNNSTDFKIDSNNKSNSKEYNKIDKKHESVIENNMKEKPLYQQENTIYEIENLFELYRESVLTNEISNQKKLADKLNSMGKTQDALTLYKKILKRAALKGDINNYLLTWSNMAEIYFKYGDIKKCKKIYLYTLALNSKNINPLITSLNSKKLALIYKSEENFLFEKALLFKSKEYENLTTLNLDTLK